MRSGDHEEWFNITGHINYIPTKLGRMVGQHAQTLSYYKAYPNRLYQMVITSLLLGHMTNVYDFISSFIS